MKRIIKTVALTAGFFFVPLIGAPELMSHYKIILLAIACSVILLTQPEFSIEEAKSKKSSDNWSVYAILIAGGLSQIIPIIEWAYFTNPATDGGTTVWTVIGGVMVVGGLSFRIWSIRTLGKFFTSTVQIVEGHRVIKTGPYAIVRHPSYLGAYLSIIGSGIFLNAPAGTIFGAIAIAWAYSLRLQAEEATLRAEFGKEYDEYTNRTPRLIPFVY